MPEDKLQMLKDYYTLPEKERVKVDVAKYDVLKDFQALPMSEQNKVFDQLGIKKKEPTGTTLQSGGTEPTTGSPQPTTSLPGLETPLEDIPIADEQQGLTAEQQFNAAKEEGRVQLDDSGNVFTALPDALKKFVFHDLPASTLGTAATGLDLFESAVRAPEMIPNIMETLNSDKTLNRQANLEVQKAMKGLEKMSKGVQEGKISQEEYEKFVSDANTRIAFLSQSGFLDKREAEPIDKAKAALVDWSMQLQESGKELTKGHVQSFRDVKGITDALDYVLTTVGETVGQIPLAFVTAGGSSMMQETGSIYIDSVRKISEERGITPREVIEQGLDNGAVSLSFGVAAGLLDRIGAGQVMKNFGKNAFKKELQRRALGLLESGGTEALTEGAQTVLEQIGANNISGGKWDSLDWNEIAEATVKGAIGGTALSSVGTAIQSERQTDETVTETPESVTDEQITAKIKESIPESEPKIVETEDSQGNTSREIEIDTGEMSVEEYNAIIEKIEQESILGEIQEVDFNYEDIIGEQEDGSVNQAEVVLTFDKELTQEEKNTLIDIATQNETGAFTFNDDKKSITFAPNDGSNLESYAEQIKTFTEQANTRGLRGYAEEQIRRSRAGLQEKQQPETEVADQAEEVTPTEETEVNLPPAPTETTTEGQTVEENIPEPVFTTKVNDKDISISIKDNDILVRNEATGTPVSKKSLFYSKAVNDYITEKVLKPGEFKPVEGEFESESEYADRVAKESNDPFEVFLAYKNLPREEVSAKDAAIRDNIKRFTLDSFARFGDLNQVKGENAFRVNYLGKKEDVNTVPIDVQAKDISESTGLDITPQNITDFVLANIKSKKQAQSKETSKHQGLANRFQQLTGLPFNEDIISRMDEAHEAAMADTKYWQTIDRIIDSEGLTLQTLEENKNLFEGFPYEQKDFESVKQKLTEQTGKKRDVGVPEVQKPSRPTTGQKPNPKPKTVTFEFAGLERTGEVVNEADGFLWVKVGKNTYPVTKEQIQGGEAAQTTRRLSNVGSVFSTVNKKQSDRILPSPILDKPAKKVKDIQANLAKGARVTLLTSKGSGRRHALGTYFPKNAAVAVKYSGDLDTTSHELGHALDDKYGIFGDIDQAAEKTKIKSELKKFSPYGSKPPKGHLNPQQYEMGEGVAEWIRAFIVNPDEATKQAPAFHDWYQSKVPASIKNEVKKFSDDIRALIGNLESDAHSFMMSKVRWEPEKSENVLTRILKPSTNDKQVFQVNFGDRLAQKWTNSMRPFEKAVAWANDLKSEEQLMPSKDPRILARLYLGMNDKIDNLLEFGLLDADNKRITDEATGQFMSLKWLIEPFEKQTEETIEKEQQETATYMISQRMVELDNRRKKQQQELREWNALPKEEKAKTPAPKVTISQANITGMGIGVFKDIQVANKRLEQHKALPEEKRQRIEEGARRYRVYADANLRYLVDTGRMSEQQYEDIKRYNADYIAFNRIKELKPGEELEIVFPRTGKGLSSAVDIVKKIKGGAEDIKNPYASLLDNTYRAVKEGDRNRIMLAFSDIFTVNRDMYQGEPLALSQVARQVTSPGERTITVFRNGQKEHWQISDTDVYKSIKGIQEDFYRLPKAATALARTLRFTVTMWPVFAARNFVRDFQHRLFVSNTGNRGYDVYFKKGVFKDTKDLYERFGGGQAGYYLKNDDFYKIKMDESMRELAKDKKTILMDPINTLKRVGRNYAKTISGSETQNRVIEFRSAFKKAKKEGMDDYNASLYAAYQARDLLDFSVAGEVTRTINQMIPFTNAAVQGLRKSFKSAKENPSGFAMRLALYGAVPAILNRILIGMMGDDREKEYQKMPAWRRDLFYNIPIGKDLWFAMPKAFEFGVVSSFFERLLDRTLYDNKNAFEGYMGSFWRTTIPVDEAAIAGPFKTTIENLTNWDFFRQKHIIPVWEEGKDLKLRHTDRASRLGQFAQKITGTDARFIDHTIRSNFSYYGDFSMKLSDIGREDSHNKFDWPTLGFFRRSSIYDSQDVQWIMSKAKKYDLTYDPLYDDLNALIQDYFAATNADEKEKRGKEVLKYAEKLRKVWEDNNIYELAIEDPEERKGARKEFRRETKFDI